MNPRIRQHAEILVEHCTEVEPDDNVLVQVRPVAEDLAVAFAEKLGEIGANPSIELTSARSDWASLRASDSGKRPAEPLLPVYNYLYTPKEIL